MFPEPIYLLGVPFHIFGILAAAGLFAGYAVTGMDLKRQGIEPDFLPDLALAVMMSAFLAARLYYVILHFNQYAADPMGVFRIWEGGMVLHAGILGGLAGGFIFCRGKKFSFLKLGDSVALALALGFAIGRLGCFFAGCCFGRPTELPWWGITFHNPLAVARPLDEALHPTQLYFFAAEMALFTFLLYRRTRKSFDGEILLTYLGLSSLIRLVLNPLRADFQTALWVLPFLIFICSLYGYVKLKKNQGRNYEFKTAV